jgi:hypothetical protein
LSPWVLLGSLALAGCTTPNKANILLRKENQNLRDRLALLERTHDADRARIRGLETSATTLPSLPADRLDELFTVHGLRIGRLTGGADLDSNKPGDEGLKIYIVPMDQAGEDLKAAGSFTIEAFDLEMKEQQKIGQWRFDLSQAKKDWYGSLLYCYVLTCPWQAQPRHPRLTVKITFTDALTGREFRAQRVVNIELPAK